MTKLCVFDMDGTLIDTLGDIAAAMNRSLEALGYGVYEKDDYKKMVGDGMRTLCLRALGKDGEADADKLVKLYKNDYIKNCCVKSKPYDGVIEAVKSLRAKGIKTAILSNKPHDQTTEIADKLFESDLFDIILGKKEEFPAKPSPESLMYLMREMGAEKDETVYVGDSDVDVKLGRAAGVTSVGVAWGFRGESELRGEGADFVVFDAKEMEEAVVKA